VPNAGHYRPGKTRRASRPAELGGVIAPDVDVADVVAAIEMELAEIVPANSGYVLVTTLQTSFTAARAR
jgi:hypothetical protein